MNFQMNIESHIPLTSVYNLEEAALVFLNQIGYLPPSYEPRTQAKGVRDSVPFRLFIDCFLKRPEKALTIGELSLKLKATKPTIYRHVNKLKSLDLLEETTPERGEKKGYRLRYGDLAKAWNFVESNVEMTMENLRKSVDHIQELAEKSR